jgi:TetR/AcrR family transcriptional regulator, transcriptional repressor for nem operon
MSTVLAAPDTASRILDIAEHLVQTRGFNAFSYADIAAALKITKASLHYHFPSKAKLGESLIERYHTTFAAALARIDADHQAEDAKLRAYVDIYAFVLDNDHMCLCGMLAADHATLPVPMRNRVRLFFDANEAWLKHLLQRGRTTKRLTFSGTPLAGARYLVSALEGAMLLARSHGEPARFHEAAARVLGEFGIARRRTQTKPAP